MNRVIRYLETNPTVEDIRGRIKNLERNYQHEKTMSAQIENQDERVLLEAILAWASK